MPYEMHHRRKVDEFSPLPFFGLSARNIAFGGIAAGIGIGISTFIYLTDASDFAMAIGSFVIMFICAPIAFMGFKSPSGGFTSYEQQLYLFLVWKFRTKDAAFYSDSIFNNQELERDEKFAKLARRNARKEREERE